MNTPDTQTPGQNEKPPAPTAIRTVNISRGAARYAISSDVHVESQLLEDYIELDGTLGWNVAGLLLAELASRLAEGHLDNPCDQFTIGLLRRHDDESVEVDVLIHQSRRDSRPCIYCFRLEERRL